MDRGFQIIARKGAGQFRILIFDREKRSHFPLTVFAAEAVKRSSDSTARVYLNAVIPFFEWLERNESGGTVRSWNDPPEAIRQGVGDYLVERLKCKVREHYAGFQLVSLTDGTQTTVRVFLSALKLFYRVMRAQNRYRYANALIDGPSAVLAGVQDRIASNEGPPRMPEVSGVVQPRKQRLSDSYFKLVGETWIPQVIDDPEFPARVLGGGQSVGWRLQEQCIARILFESGCRVSEVVGLSLRDWAARGLLQEAQAFNKGSHGRRVKFIRFSAATAKLLRRCFDTERRQFDRNHHVLDDYLQSAAHETNLYHVPLFLCRRGTQLSPKAFREGCWNPACRAAGLDADVHQARHWYVTQAIRSIYTGAQSESDINRRLRELIEYMGWKSGWETLEAYQHYFDPQRHAEIQDQLHQRMDQTLNGDLAQPPGRHSPVTAPSGAVIQVETAGRSSHDDERDSDLEYLLALGGGRGIAGDGE
jgi:integrase